jgi:hypothetical protein
MNTCPDLSREAVLNDLFVLFTQTCLPVGGRRPEMLQPFLAFVSGKVLIAFLIADSWLKLLP